MRESETDAPERGLRDQLRRLNEYRTGERYIPAGTDRIPGATPPTVPFKWPPFDHRTKTPDRDEPRLPANSDSGRAF